MTGDGTKVYQQGKVTIIEYPDVYHRFVSTLLREHDDLVRAMALAQCKFEDGTALDFLNRMLGTNVTRLTPMEIGYSQLLDALNMRVKSLISQDKAQEIAQGFKDMELSPLAGMPDEVREKIEGQPLFPSWDQVEEDNERKGRKKQ